MQAILVASSLAMLSLQLPPVSIVSSAAVSLVTLRRGGNEGLFILICSCLSAALFGFVILGNFEFAIMYGLGLWLPVWLVSIILKEVQSLSVTIQITHILGMIGVVGFFLYIDSPTEFWLSKINLVIQTILDNTAGLPDQEKLNVFSQNQELITLYAKAMTGVFITGGIMSLFLGLFLARMWQAALYNPGGFRDEYLALRTHPVFIIILISSVAIGNLMTGFMANLGWNIAIVLMALYALIGLSTLHFAFSHMKTGRFLVPFLYISLIITPGAAGVILIIVGLIDAGLNLRKFFQITGT